MKILMIHSDGFRYEVLEKARGVKAEPVQDKIFEVKGKTLIAFTSVEETDQQKPAEITDLSFQEITNLAKDLKEKNIVLYPWAHLSEKLASPKMAQEILHSLYDRLQASGYTVHSAAFGWYKAFQLNCLGHNRAENLRTITVESLDKAKVQEVEEHPPSRFYLYTPKDQLIELTITKKKTKGKETLKIKPAEPFPLDSYKDLQAFLAYEMKKERTESQEPPHLAYMRRHELASADPSSDPGNLRWYPRGRIIRRLIEEFAYQKTASFGAVPIETPIMYNLEIPAVREQVSRFPARQYRVFSGDKQLFLRYASDFGLFFMISNIHLSYRNLPLRIYELTKYSFRREKRGEVVGLRRLRAFTMPDLHTFCEDQQKAQEEFALQYDLCLSCVESFNVPFEIAFRTTQDFFKENRQWLHQIVKKSNKPILLELYDDRHFYWILKFEFNMVDAVKKAAALATVQIDVETAKRYGITFQDTDGKRKHPVILHNSPTGAVERVIYAILEHAARMEKKGQVPTYPLWLAPTQVRLIPITEAHIDFCDQLRQQLHGTGIRVDIDDRTDRPNKKVRTAEREWVPYIILIGDNEMNNTKFPIRTRTRGREIRELSLQELTKEIMAELADKPRNPLPLPYQRLSRRPTFIEQQ